MAIIFQNRMIRILSTVGLILLYYRAYKKRSYVQYIYIRAHTYIHI